MDFYGRANAARVAEEAKSGILWGFPRQHPCALLGAVSCCSSEARDPGSDRESLGPLRCPSNFEVQVASARRQARPLPVSSSACVHISPVSPQQQCRRPFVPVPPEPSELASARLTAEDVFLLYRLPRPCLPACLPPARSEPEPSLSEDLQAAEVVSDVDIALGIAFAKGGLVERRCLPARLAASPGRTPAASTRPWGRAGQRPVWADCPLKSTRAQASKARSKELQAMAATFSTRRPPLHRPSDPSGPFP